MPNNLPGDLPTAIRIYPQCESHLYTLTDPFVLELDKTFKKFALITKKSLHYYSFTSLIREQRRRGMEMALYKEQIWARFELSNFPQHALLGPMLVLKFLKVVQPGLSKAQFPLMTRILACPSHEGTFCVQTRYGMCP